MIDKPCLLVGITGASGIRYALRLLELCDLLTKHYRKVVVVYTKYAKNIAELEEGVDLGKSLHQYRCVDQVFKWNEMHASIASSSNLFAYEGVIVPATLNTIAKLATGIQDNLLLRAFSSLIRLKRKVVVVVRETPLSQTDLLNLYKLSKLGAIILPASPGFYGNPASISDLIDFVVGKILDALGVEHNLYRRWIGKSETYRKP